MSVTPASSRHRAREAALQVLYALDLEESRRGEPVPAREVFERVAGHFEMPEGARAFAVELVCQCQRRRAELDAAIREHSRNWRLERMGIVDRNVLRLAAYELLFTGTPAAVVIDEAVRLAHRFGAEQSARFVNGIADAIARSRTAAEKSA